MQYNTKPNNNSH